jgi:hypothetical protein
MPVWIWNGSFKSRLSSEGAPQPVIAQRLRIARELTRDVDPSHEAMGVGGSFQRVESSARLVSIRRLDSESCAVRDDRFQRDMPAGCRFATQTVEERLVEAVQIVVVVPHGANQVLDAVDAADRYAATLLEIVERDRAQAHIDE